MKIMVRNCLFASLFFLSLTGCKETRTDLHFGINLGDSNQVVMEKTGVTDFLQKEGSIWEEFVWGAYNKSHLVAVIDLLEEVGDVEGINSLFLMNKIENSALKEALDNLEKKFPLKYQVRYCVRACRKRHPELNSYKDMTFIFLDGYLIYGRTEYKEQGEYSIDAKVDELKSEYEDLRKEAPVKQVGAVIQKFSLSQNVTTLLPQADQIRTASDLKKSNVVVASIDRKTVQVLKTANLGCSELTPENYNQILPFLNLGSCLAPYLMQELEKEVRRVAGK